MSTPEFTMAVQEYGRSLAQALDTILPLSPGEDAWCDRLRSWFAACATAPWRAVRQPDLDTVVTDLVTLELSCQAFAATAEGLEVTDLGGTVWARRALAELLATVARHDPRTAGDLARLACRTRNDRLHRIRSLILACA